ncbi:apoptosis facilitator Bcl-2-like protein 14 [Rhinichthys klamathensis goyatoka]|uniref:apoptosis facilitator Bcl-2-like protein 14 n=1 Tax=Rhinichthys klamathensis goyatoka TaxID=3034132 RepID=UPI0024B5C037|nr:apoptosis facilitator Bcl-2-like protein 14 [Rhinichthys klamathensis goyatoka]
MAQEHSNGDVQIPAVDSLEFRLLMSYARKRRPMDTSLQQDIPEREVSEKRSRRMHKKKKLRLSFITKCIKPKTDDTPEPQQAALDDGKVDEMENMVSELTEISDSVHFTSSDIESDGDDVVQRLAEILRLHGDELDEKIKKDKALYETLQSSFKYSFFKKVMDTFCRSVTLELPTEDEKVDVALICEATSQLYGVNYHPMNRVLGFGAKYLQENYSKWISRNMHVGSAEVGDESKEEVQ